MTPLQKRCWNNDGRMLNEQDAIQCVESYRNSYSAARFRNLIALAIRNGHPDECRIVFEMAMAEIKSKEIR